jgi:hypothetical protein
MRVLAGPPTRPVLAIHAFNSERRPVEIVRAGVIAANGSVVWHGPETPELPARLGDGESIEIRLPDEWIELVRASTGQEALQLAVMGAGGKIYASEPRDLPSDEQTPT